MDGIDVDEGAGGGAGAGTRVGTGLGIASVVVPASKPSKMHNTRTKAAWTVVYGAASGISGIPRVRVPAVASNVDCRRCAVVLGRVSGVVIALNDGSRRRRGSWSRSWSRPGGGSWSWGGTRRWARSWSRGS